MDRGHNQVPSFSNFAGDVYSRAAGASNSSAALDTYWTKAKAPVASVTATVAAADTLILDVNSEWSKYARFRKFIGQWQFNQPE